MNIHFNLITGIAMEIHLEVSSKMDFDTDSVVWNISTEVVEMANGKMIKWTDLFFIIYLEKVPLPSRDGQMVFKYP